LALALSQSEAEEKEKLKLRGTAQILSAGANQVNSSAPRSQEKVF
jgi:hypothetical protein